MRANEYSNKLAIPFTINLASNHCNANLEFWHSQLQKVGCGPSIVCRWMAFTFKILAFANLAFTFTFYSHSQLFTFTSLAFSLSSYYRAFNWSSISYLQSSAKFRFIVQIHRSHNISIFCKIQLLQTFNACMCNKTRFPSLTFLHYYFCTTH